MHYQENNEQKADKQIKPMNRKADEQKQRCSEITYRFQKGRFLDFGTGLRDEEKLKSKITGQDTRHVTLKKKVAVMEKLTKPGKIKLKINRKDIAG